MDDWPNGRLASTVFFGERRILASYSAVEFDLGSEEVRFVPVKPSEGSALAFRITCLREASLEFKGRSEPEGKAEIRGVLLRSAPFPKEPVVYTGFVERFRDPNPDSLDDDSNDSEDIECTGGTGGGATGSKEKNKGEHDGPHGSNSSQGRLLGESEDLGPEWPSANISATSAPPSAFCTVGDWRLILFEPQGCPNEVLFRDKNGKQARFKVTGSEDSCLTFEGPWQDGRAIGTVRNWRAFSVPIYFGTLATVDSAKGLVVVAFGGSLGG